MRRRTASRPVCVCVGGGGADKDLPGWSENLFIPADVPLKKKKDVRNLDGLIKGLGGHWKPRWANK